MSPVGLATTSISTDYAHKSPRSLHGISKCTKFLVHVCAMVLCHDHASAMPCRVGYVPLHMQLLKSIWEVVLFFWFHPCLNAGLTTSLWSHKSGGSSKHSVRMPMTSCSLLEYRAYYHIERGDEFDKPSL